MYELFTRSVEIGGSKQEVTFYQPAMEQMVLIRDNQPDWMEEQELPVPESELSDEQIQSMMKYARLIVDSTTDIDSATVQRLGQSALKNLTEYCKLALHGEEPESKEQNELSKNPFEGIEMDHRGNVDLEEMR
jgi:hypothetical protein